MASPSFLHPLALSGSARFDLFWLFCTMTEGCLRKRPVSYPWIATPPTLPANIQSSCASARFTTIRLHCVSTGFQTVLEPCTENPLSFPSPWVHQVDAQRSIVCVFCSRPLQPRCNQYISQVAFESHTTDLNLSSPQRRRVDSRGITVFCPLLMRVSTLVCATIATRFLRFRKHNL